MQHGVSNNEIIGETSILTSVGIASRFCKRKYRISLKMLNLCAELKRSIVVNSAQNTKLCMDAFLKTESNRYMSSLHGMSVF